MQVFINRDLISSLNGGDNQLSGGGANQRLMTQLGTRRLTVRQGGWGVGGGVQHVRREDVCIVSYFYGNTLENKRTLPLLPLGAC